MEEKKVQSRREIKIEKRRKKRYAWLQILCLPHIKPVWSQQFISAALVSWTSLRMANEENFNEV